MIAYEHACSYGLIPPPRNSALPIIGPMFYGPSRKLPYHVPRFIRAEVAERREKIYALIRRLGRPVLSREIEVELQEKRRRIASYMRDMVGHHLIGRVPVDSGTAHYAYTLPGDKERQQREAMFAEWDAAILAAIRNSVGGARFHALTHAVKTNPPFLTERLKALIQAGKVTCEKTHLKHALYREVKSTKGATK